VIGGEAQARWSGRLPRARRPVCRRRERTPIVKAGTAPRSRPRDTGPRMRTSCIRRHRPCRRPSPPAPTPRARTRRAWLTPDWGEPTTDVTAPAMVAGRRGACGVGRPVSAAGPPDRGVGRRSCFKRRPPADPQERWDPRVAGGRGWMRFHGLGSEAERRGADDRDVEVDGRPGGLRKG